MFIFDLFNINKNSNLVLKTFCLPYFFFGFLSLQHRKSLVSSIYCGYQPWLAQPKNSDRMKEQEETILDARSTKTFITRNPVMRTKGKVKQMTKVTIPTTKRGSDTEAA